MKLCETCTNKYYCRNYKQIVSQQKLDLIDCDDYSFDREGCDEIQGLQKVQD